MTDTPPIKEELRMRSTTLAAVAAVALGFSLAACSNGSEAPTVASIKSHSTTTAAGGGSAAGTPLAQAQAYSRCIRKHGVANFPDPVLTPGGDYGYRTDGVDGNSATFQAALRACADLPSPWNSEGKQLSPAEQQAWLRWAKCIRSNGVPDFPDPTFSGESVRVNRDTNSAQFESATKACKAKLPSTGGFGG